MESSPWRMLKFNETPARLVSCCISRATALGEPISGRTSERRVDAADPALRAQRLYDELFVGAKDDLTSDDLRAHAAGLAACDFHGGACNEWRYRVAN